VARPIFEQALEAIEDVVRRHPGGVRAQEIASALAGGPPRRTLQQYRLQRLAEQGRLTKEGERRWTKYRIPTAAAGQAVAAARESEAQDVIPCGNRRASPIRSG